MLIRRTFIAAVATAAATGAWAARPTVQLEQDPTADMAAYRSYSWIRRGPQKGVDPAIAAGIRASIDRQLAAQGYTQSATPDFMVTFLVGVNEKAGPHPTLLTVPTRTGLMIVGKEVRLIREGALAIEVYDAASQRPVWRATAAKELPARGANPRLIDQVVNEALARLPARQ